MVGGAGCGGDGFFVITVSHSTSSCIVVDVGVGL